MRKYRVIRSARTDMQEIWNYIAEDNAPAASMLVGRFRGGFNLLAENPGVGHTRADLTALPVLFHPIGTYLILYRLNGEQVEILAVLHGARDVRTILSQRLDL